MEVQELSWSSANHWNSPSPDLPNADLVLYFGSRRVLLPEWVDELRQRFGRAHVVGCSTGGQILHRHVSDNDIIAIALDFAATSVRVASTDIDEAGASARAGVDLGQQLAAPDLGGVFVLSDGLKVNGSALASGLTCALPAGTIITGGLAGDGTEFGATCVGVDGAPVSGRVAAIGFYGPAVRFGYGSAGGWSPFGPRRNITRSQGNVLLELDGKSALVLYERYLGPDEAAQLPASGLLFPLEVHDPEKPDEAVVRTLLAVDRDARTMTFAGDIPEGWVAQLMYAGPGDLAVGAGQSAAEAIGRMPVAGGPAVALLVSCIGRRMVMGQRVVDEIASVAAKFPPATTQCGFYSYGELSPHASSGVCSLRNQTMTVTVVSEAT